MPICNDERKYLTAYCYGIWKSCCWFVNKLTAYWLLEKHRINRNGTETRATSNP